MEQEGATPAANPEPAELEPEPKLDPKSQPEPGAEPGPGAESVPGVEPGAGSESRAGSGLGAEPGPGAESRAGSGLGADRGSRVEPGFDPGAVSDLGLGFEPGPGSEPGAGSEPRPVSEPGSEWERQQRIAARRSRVDVRRREALGEEVEKEEEEEEEEDQGMSLRLIEETGKVLAKLLFHGTQLLTNVQVEADLRESRRREKDGEEKRRRMEKLETEARRGSEKLEEINSKWAQAGDLRVPQELWELLEQQRDQCEQLLRDKNQLIRELQQELVGMDVQYEQALEQQGQEIRVLLERMEEQTRNMLRTYRHHVRQIEKTFEEERREMLTSNRRRWNEAIQAHNEQELQFLRDKIDKALEFENLLTELQEESVGSYDSFRLQLEQDVQDLEKRLQQMKGLYHLNQVKLEYNLEVLRQLDVENSTFRSLQKRKINRLQTSLSLLRTKMANQEKKFQEERQSLELELGRIKEQFQETQSRMRDLARSSAEKFRQVWMVNEEEAKELIRKTLDADRIIHVQQLGMPWEEPHFWFMENVGPLGDRREKKEAMQVVMALLEGIKSGKRDQGGRSSKKKGSGRGEGRKENQERLRERAATRRDVPRETLLEILELLTEESEFLVENKLLRTLRQVVGPRDTVGQLRSVLEILRVEDDDDLRKLLDFFLYLGYKGGTSSQVKPGGENPTDPAQDGGNGRSQFQRDELQSLQSSIPTRPIEVDDVLKILQEFLKDFPKLRDEEIPREIREVRDSSRDAEYWESMTRIIPERTLRLWDALGAALTEYHKVLARRSELFSEATALQRQNSELGILLEEYLGSEPGQ